MKGLGEGKMKLLARTAACALALGMIGCGSDGSDKPAGDGNDEVGETTIELFSWWTQPGEAEALEALIELHHDEFPNERILNAAEVATNGGVDAKMVLAQRLKDNDPPDVFQQNAFEVLGALADGTGKFEQLDDFFKEQGLDAKVVPQEILDNVSHEGHMYSLPVNIHRENSLFYNMKVFKEHDITPPKTTDELLAACEKLKAAGVTPFAVSPQSWILGKMFEGIAEGAMGPASFVDYYTKGTIDEAKLKLAVDTYAKIVMDYSNIGKIDENFGWTQAAEAVQHGEAAMFLHGDWVKGYLVQLGAEPNVDFGVVVAPGAQDMFVYGVDVFVVPQGAKHRDAAFDFLTTVASPAGQAAFNTIKGSTPMRFDVPVSKLDVVAQEVLKDFKNAKMRVALHGSPALSDAVGWFTWMTPEHTDYYNDTSMLLRAAMENPPDNP
jgi:glucose/mannose transport system substrate-binding protein